LNAFTAIDSQKNPEFCSYVLQKLAQLMAPMTPHLSEELWEMLGQHDTIFKSHWPDYDPEAVVADTITIVVQVNGKVRENLQVPPDIQKDDLLEQAKASERVAKFFEGKKIIKEIVVPGRLVNFVVK